MVQRLHIYPEVTGSSPAVVDVFFFQLKIIRKLRSENFRPAASVEGFHCDLGLIVDYESWRVWVHFEITSQIAMYWVSLVTCSPLIVVNNAAFE